MFIQQLQGELKNVPADASQVCRSTTRSLNKEETLSVDRGCGSMTDNKLTCNNPEVNPAEQTPRSVNAFMFALDETCLPIDGKAISITKVSKFYHFGGFYNNVKNNSYE